MKMNLPKWSAREAGLGIAVLVTVLGFVPLRSWILPAKHRLDAAVSQYGSNVAEYRKLSAFLDSREEADRLYADLDPAVLQSDTDFVTLSHFLRRLETLASRHRTLTLANAKPEEPEGDGAVRHFPLRLTTSGSFPELVVFVTELLNEPVPVALESFTLRGTQGGEQVECGMRLVLTTLVAEPPRGNP